MTTWAELFNKYFPRNGWLASEDDVRIAGEEIDLFFTTKRPDNEELCDAVRYLAGPKAKKKYGAISLKDLMIAVCIIRKKNRVIDDKDEKNQCEICFSGWIDYYPEYKANWTLDDFSRNYCVNFPCRCDAGRTLVDKCKPYADWDDSDRHDLERVSRKAIAQQGHRNKLALELGEKMDGKKSVYKHNDIIKKAEVASDSS